MRTALLQVKEELGSEAVIMSNKKVAGGVEIVAAIDGESSPSTASPRLNKPQQPAQSQYTQMAAPAVPAGRRQLDDDKVSLQSNTEGGRSMTKRFANMLKQYSHGADEDSQHRAENEDSLSALLNRQTGSSHQSHGNQNSHGHQSLPSHKGSQSNQQSQSRNSNIDSAFARETGLSKLIAEDRRVERPAPRLDPTRYDRGRDPVQSKGSDTEMETMRDVQELGRVSVTGSRIKRTDIEGATPLITITRSDIESQGFQTVYDAVSNLTQNTGSINGENFQAGFNGSLQPINLRDFGPGRTLVLVNGKRTADYPFPYNGESASFNWGSIPLGSC